MSLSTLNSKFNPNVDLKTEYLIFGYVRNENISIKTIPQSIIKLLIKFYYSIRSRIVYIKSNKTYWSSSPPTVYIGELNDNKNYNEFNIQLLNESKSVKHSFDSNSGICYVTDFKLPSNICTLNKNLNENVLYDIVFTAQFGNKQCTAYIIDTICNNIYSWKLPQFTKCACGQYLLYSKKYGLISVGDGYDHRDGSNDLTVLNFNDFDDLKWKNMKWKWTEGEHGRPNLAATFINDDKMICCGGGGSYSKLVDLYDFTTNKMVKLQGMNKERGCCGICIDEFVNDNVYIAGGYHSPHTFEYLDIHENKWISLADMTGKHDQWPLIWNDEPNVILITGASDRKQFERMDIRENKWSDHVLYDKQTIDDLFGTKVKISCYARLLMA